MDIELGMLPEFPGYAVSTEGKVFSLARKNSVGAQVHFKELKQNTDRGGYKYVILSNAEGERKYMNVHRLVALAFIPNPENKPTVNHEDQCKSNNHVSNLTWMTQAENNLHYRNSHVCKSKPKSTRCKKVKATHIETGEVTIYDSVNACARGIGDGSSNVSATCKGTQKSSKGYKLEYVS